MIAVGKGPRLRIFGKGFMFCISGAVHHLQFDCGGVHGDFFHNFVPQHHEALWHVEKLEAVACKRMLVIKSAGRVVIKSAGRESTCGDWTGYQ